MYPHYIDYLPMDQYSMLICVNSYCELRYFLFTSRQNGVTLVLRDRHLLRIEETIRGMGK
ncbi:hypothetical protein [Vulcanisaeta thermophila]|uniref:hypothetical protein n=1 Tax=Vulcanisaeta thermophila TaxID=867917 RepID=UPI000852EC83|nr:hypothetical protein [Vulcanisaeta thermophila]